MNNSDTVVDVDLARAAARLIAARECQIATTPVRDVVGTTDVNRAYAVQHRLTEARTAAGARVVGRKIGLTSSAVQAQLGVDRPDFGVLFDDMHIESGGAVDITTLIQPRIEAEIAFLLGADLDHDDLTHGHVRDAVDHAVAALEIVDSRIADWDITYGDTVADNASSGLFVLGTHPRTLDDGSPADVEMTMAINDDVVSTGNGAACLGDPLQALLWLARTAHELGDPLRAGQIVLSGALGPMRPVVAGDVVRTTITGLGTAEVSFHATEQGATP